MGYVYSCCPEVLVVVYWSEPREGGTHDRACVTGRLKFGVLALMAVGIYWRSIYRMMVAMAHEIRVSGMGVFRLVCVLVSRRRP